MTATPRGPHRSPPPGDSAQMLILMGFILALAFITVTILLGEVITTSNVASVESTDILKGDVFQALRAVKDQVDFARTEYNSTSNQNDFARFMNNTTLAVQAMFASRGIAVGVNWSGAGFLDAIIRTQDDGKIAYCGRPNASSFTIRNWLIEKGFQFTDYSYGVDCADRGTDASPTGVGKMFAELCAEGTNSTVCGIAPGVAISSNLNQTVAIFEFDSLKVEESAAGNPGCTKSGVDQLNVSQCKTLQNWTRLGGKFIKTGALTGFTFNATIIDVLTHVARVGPDCLPIPSCSWRGYSSGGDTTVDVVRQGLTDQSGVVAPFPLLPATDQGVLSPLVKNVAIGDFIQFASPGYAFSPFSTPPQGVMASGVCVSTSVTNPGSGPICGPALPYALALNWTYGSGQVYYLPTLEGELRTSLGKKVIADPDDLRPIFNLTSPGGNCKVNATVEDWRTRFDVQLLC